MFTFPQQKENSSLFAMIFISITLLLTGCASNEVIETEVGVVEAEEGSEVDPYEGFNRTMFVFNDELDTYVAAPISDAYLWVTPQFVQTGVSNFFDNLKGINVVLNDMMQGKVSQGAEDTGRFAVNSTLGLLGLFDVATEFGLEKHDEDFAQTLAVWGVPQGPYLVLPVLGPATSRGIPGGIFDAAANPATYVGAPVQLLQMLNARANAEGALNFIDEAALDPYVFTREAFLQHRKHLITDGESEVTDDLLDLEDDFYEDDEEDLSASVGAVAVEPMADVVSDVAPEEVMAVDGSINNQNVERSSHALTLSSDVESYGEASNSFDGAVKSFDDASRSFEEAAEKLEQLQNQ